jgi:hypothetical protein
LTSALCLDFGTSSIRAVRRMPSGKLKPLDIGRVARSQLDDASIRSEIHIDEHGKYVRFGERALIERQNSPNPLLFEASPKLWLKEPHKLHLPAANGLSLTRENLLAGLLANAFGACIKSTNTGAATVSKGTVSKMDVRVAHPVWPGDIESESNAAIRRICAQAMRMAFVRDWATVTVAALFEQTRIPGPSGESPVDVVEPVAAAVELLPAIENARRVCAVIDIGAGTTDIGLFQAVSPDSASTVRGKLYPLGGAVSVFKAGNVIDDIVLDVLKSRASRTDPTAIAGVKSRIRQVKETLFRDGFVQEMGVDVRLDDIQSHPEAKSMAREIREEFAAAVARSGEEILRLMMARTHSVTRLELVMAGGGAAIEFIRNAIEKPLMVDGKELPVKILLAEAERGVDLFGAGRDRMAVALGGARVEYDELIHRMPKLDRISMGRL